MNKTILRKALLVLAAVLAFGAAGAQNQRLSLPSVRMSALDAFSEIRRQTGIGVAYSTGRLDPNRVVTFPSRELTVNEAVKAIVESAGVAHSYEDRMILVTGAAETPRNPEMVMAEGYVPSSAADFNTPLGTRPVDAPEQVAVAAPRVVVTEPGVPVSRYGQLSEYTATQGKSPRFALKTNLLYGLGTLTPNLSLEFATGRKTTLELGASYNPWNLKGSLESNRKLVHMIIKPEFRWWLCERFDGHFFGIHAIYSRYNIGTYEVPRLFEKEYRYNGHAVGGGITYGYNWAFAKRWGAEFAVGVGALWLKYDRFDCAACNRDPKPVTKTYFGPTNASVSLVFLIR
uniref:DUF3575 domain-containing protein n=1 Tax=termite gut metagenome TaxID=433724 RepID=S0DGI4_9ZZZZ